MDFFVPGRTELIGNHTDHQKGRVIASAVAPGIHAQAEPTADGVITIRSQGYGAVTVDVRDLAPRAEETGTTAALVRGMAAALQGRDAHIGGFTATLRSELPAGGGLSSSAAFTVLIGRILSAFYENGTVDPVTIAECARDAENLHFGKPSGLMDQLACAIGQAVYIDFHLGEIRPLDCDFSAMGLVLCLTNTGGSHAGLTDAYAEIPADMRAVAAEFGQEVLRYVNYEDFLASKPPWDRAHDRARHFFEENARVLQMLDAIENKDRTACIEILNASGRSSEQLLRNIRADGGDDALERGLALSAKLLEGRGAWRVHGGGFAGCVQALVPTEDFSDYRSAMEAAFGPDSCIRIM